MSFVVAHDLSSTRVSRNPFTAQNTAIMSSAQKGLSNRIDSLEFDRVDNLLLDDLKHQQNNPFSLSWTPKCDIGYDPTYTNARVDTCDSAIARPRILIRCIVNCMPPVTHTASNVII